MDADFTHIFGLGLDHATDFNLRTPALIFTPENFGAAVPLAFSRPFVSIRGLTQRRYPVADEIG
jgi:hypothetical protein